jgi:hypothetical protein
VVRSPRNRPQTQAQLAMAFSIDWPVIALAHARPLGPDGLETGHHFHNRPPANEDGNQAMLVQACLQQNTSALDALCAFFSLSVFKNTRFDNNLWKTMALTILMWDLPTLFATRAVAKRFTFVTWQYCRSFQHFRMAGQRTIRKPVIRPFEPIPGLIECLAANDKGAHCRKQEEDTQQDYGPLRNSPASLPWRPTHRCAQCNRQCHGSGQLYQHELYCAGTGDDYAITGDSD